MSKIGSLPATSGASDSSSPAAVWWVAVLAGLSVAWPLTFAAIINGPQVLIRSLSGDAYHYLEIGRNAVISHIYTYDGTHVTNGFHPLWQYTIRALFTVLGLESHESQGVAVIILALVVATLGVCLASAAVVRMTRMYFLGLLLVPGLFYMAIGVHVTTLPIWMVFDGMESALCTFFGGILFYILSRHYGASARQPVDVLKACRELGLVLPFIVLSRLDDVFILPAMVIALFLFERSRTDWFRASLWLTAPTVLAIMAYLAYNQLTVGAAMPLSGATKAGFVGFVTAYISGVIHFPPLLNLKNWLTGSPSDGGTLFSNAFRFVEMVYPMLLAGFGALALWISRASNRKELWPFFAICLYILFKVGYNFLNVHPWHQANWYYAFAVLSLSVLGACALREPWRRLGQFPVAKYGIATTYIGVMLLSGANYYAVISYRDFGGDKFSIFWERAPEIRQQLVARGVRGLINVDDGSTAFLLDFPNLHGFAFATDLEAQEAYKHGRLLTLAASRGIDTITGEGYLNMDQPLYSSEELRKFLLATPAETMMRAEVNAFDFSLLYYDTVLKMPFISFKPIAK
jgi:hypothetical protein